ncbi:MAG: 50S ribosomal protein L32 [Chloroflexota bacterium]
MGALPKRKTSRSKRRTRRSQDRASFGAIVLCGHCRRPHLSHRVCRHCGYYAGREVIAPKEAAV